MENWEFPALLIYLLTIIYLLALKKIKEGVEEEERNEKGYATMLMLASGIFIMYTVAPLLAVFVCIVLPFCRQEAIFHDQRNTGDGEGW